MVRSTPHLQVLGLPFGPEIAQIWLIPNINRQSSRGAVRIDVSDELRQVRIPGRPVAIISRVSSCGVLSSVGSPEIMNEEDEVGIVFASSLVV